MSDQFLLGHMYGTGGRVSRSGKDGKGVSQGGKGKVEEKSPGGVGKNVVDDLLPQKVSEISPNVIFQDIDKSSPSEKQESPKKYQRQKRGEPIKAP